jgi:hypothetical protein
MQSLIQCKELYPVFNVHYYLIHARTGRIITHKKTHNIITNKARERLALYMKGDSISSPAFVGIGTGTNNAVAGDIALQTPVDYDGANDAKVASIRDILSTYKSRTTVQFGSSEANQNIRELGLFDAANAGNLWARVNVTINKTSAQILTVYWYISFERATGVAIKTGQSVAATGTITGQVDSTLTFPSTVTFLMVENNTGVVVYIKINGAMTGTPPTGYDYRLEASGIKSRLELVNEEISISNIHVYKDSAGNITLPANTFVAVGW